MAASLRLWPHTILSALLILTESVQLLLDNPIPDDVWKDIEASKDAEITLLMEIYEGQFQLPIDMDEVLKCMEIEVREFTAPPTAVVKAVTDGRGEAIIEYNRRLTDKQKRLGLAVGLAHILMHPSHVPYIDFDLFGPVDSTVEALNFAKRLLIPELVLLHFHNVYQGHIRSLSEKFGLPVQFMKLRLEDLGLL